MKNLNFFDVCLLILLGGNHVFGSVYSDWEKEMAKGPPGVSDFFPPLDQRLVRLDVIDVTFWEPVMEVIPSDLTVNNSPATHVEADEGNRTYTFRGFATPTPGTVVVKLHSGNIKDTDNLLFDGESWTYQFFDSITDEDGDGLNNEKEITLGTHPMKKDTDEDGLPDGYEAAHPCLNPAWNEAFVGVYEPPGTFTIQMSLNEFRDTRLDPN